MTLQFSGSRFLLKFNPSCYLRGASEFWRKYVASPVTLRAWLPNYVLIFATHTLLGGNLSYKFISISFPHFAVSFRMTQSVCGRSE